jgi:hypothetical protein
MTSRHRCLNQVLGLQVSEGQMKMSTITVATPRPGRVWSKFLEGAQD